MSEAAAGSTSLGAAFDSFWVGGDLGSALEKARREPEDEPVSCAGLAVLELLAGNLGAAAGVAQRRGSDLGSGTAGWILDAVSVAVGAWRGDVATPPRPGADRWANALGMLLVADAASTAPPPLAAGIADEAVGQAERAGDPRLVLWADRCRASALVEAGDHQAGSSLAGRLSDADSVEAARNDRVRGTAALRLGDLDVAKAKLQSSVEVISRAGLALEAVQSLIALSEADHEQARAHLRRAAELIEEAGADPAFQRLLDRRPTLELTMLGAQSMAVGGELVKPKTSHAEQLVFGLALAGGSLDAGELCARLWPGKEAEDASGNLTTSTWEARVALGREAWRLDRVGDRLTLDLEGVRIDLDDTIAALESDGYDPALVDRLQLPVLPAWRHEDWVIEADERRAAFAARFG